MYRLLALGVLQSLNLNQYFPQFDAFWMHRNSKFWCHMTGPYPHGLSLAFCGMVILGRMTSHLFHQMLLPCSHPISVFKWDWRQTVSGWMTGSHHLHIPSNLFCFWALHIESFLQISGRMTGLTWKRTCGSHPKLPLHPLPFLFHSFTQVHVACHSLSLSFGDGLFTFPPC